jgi:hypothetical protein
MSNNLLTREAVRMLLIKHDPLLAVNSLEHQQDEYDSEIEPVLNAVAESEDWRQLRVRLLKIFRNVSGVFVAGTRFRYSELARELMKLKTGNEASMVLAT